MASKKVAMFVDYDVTIRTTTELCGTLPNNEKSQDAFLKSLKIPNDEADAAKENMLGEVPTEEMPVESVVNVFKSDDDGLFIEGRQIKAAIKESANILGFTNKNNPGRQYLQSGVSVHPQKLHLGVHEASGVIQQRGVIIGPQGQRAIVTTRAYVAPGVELSFTVRCVQGRNAMTNEKMALILDLMQETGLGSGRPQGYGQFEVVSVTSHDVYARITIKAGRSKTVAA